MLIGALWVAQGRLVEQVNATDYSDRLDGASPYSYGEDLSVGHGFTVPTLVVAADVMSSAAARATCNRLASAVARSSARRVWVVGSALHSTQGFECGRSAEDRVAPLDGVLAQRLSASLRAHDTQLVLVDTTGRAVYSSDADALEALQDVSPTLFATKPKKQS